MGVRNYASSFRVAATRLVGSHKMGGTLVDELPLIPSSPLPNCALVSIRPSRPRRHSYKGDSRESTGDGTLVLNTGQERSREWGGAPSKLREMYERQTDRPPQLYHRDTRKGDKSAQTNVVCLPTFPFAPLQQVIANFQSST